MLDMEYIIVQCIHIYYLLEGPSPTRYSTTLSITPLSLGITGRGKGGPPLVIPPGGIPDKLDKIYNIYIAKY